MVKPADLPFTIALIGFEGTLGLVLLSGHGNVARRANWSGVAFNTALIPSLAFPYWLGNVALIGVHATLACTPEPATAIPTTRSPREVQLHR